jgi:hypothetical protein
MSLQERSLSFDEVFFSEEEGLFIKSDINFNVNKNYINILKRMNIDGCYKGNSFFTKEAEDTSKYYYVRGYSGPNNSFKENNDHLAIEIEGPNAESLIKSTSLCSSILNKTQVISSTKVRVNIFLSSSIEKEIFDIDNHEFIFDKGTFESEFRRMFASVTSLKSIIKNFNAIEELYQRACSLECGRVVISVPKNTDSNLSSLYDISVWTSGTQLKEVKERNFHDLPAFGTLPKESQKQITDKHLIKNGAPLLHNFQISDSTQRRESHSLTIDYSVNKNMYCVCTNIDNDGQLLIKNYYYLSGVKKVTNLTTSQVTTTNITPTGFLVQCTTDLNNINILI